MRRLYTLVPIALAVVAFLQPLDAKELQLAIKDGRVTLVARDVPLSEILAEWARVGQTTIVDGDKLTGPAVTLELVDVTEAQALQTLLRSASGYLAAPRRPGVPGTSYFDRILILASSRAPRASPAPPVFESPRPADGFDAPTRDPQPAGGPPFGLTPEQSEQYQQLQQLLQQPAPGAPVAADPNDPAQRQQNLPQTTPRPGMPTGAAAQPGMPTRTVVQPGGSGRQQQPSPPPWMQNPFVTQPNVQSPTTASPPGVPRPPYPAAPAPQPPRQQ